MATALSETAIAAAPIPNWEQMQAIPIADNGEVLIPTSISPHWSVWPAYYHANITGAISECYLRRGVFDRLIVASQLLPPEYRLVILDAWRPFAVQTYLFEKLQELLKRYQPTLSDSKRYQLARTLVSPPSAELHAPSPHLTGASVDVTLCDLDGRLVNMGTLFDEASPLSYAAALENDEADQEARHNRRILFNAMKTAGFTNLPSEWWHYDFGNQLWAYHSGAQQAVYGVAQPVSQETRWQDQLRNWGPISE